MNKIFDKILEFFGLKRIEGAPVVQVDVVSQLEQLEANSQVKLNWRESIVDLLKLIGVDSSRQNRNALAKELGCPAELMKDSAKMNEWLRKEVMKKLAENGGNVPQELID